MSNSQELQTYPVSACNVWWQYVGLSFLALWSLDSLEVTKKIIEVRFHVMYVHT